MGLTEQRLETPHLGKPETFNFLAFTHSCAKTRKESFTVLRQTMRKRWQAKLREVKSLPRQ
jgi:RNA-directed DNA polymerase